MNQPGMDRALALSCDRALFGLTPEQEMELVALLPPGTRIDAGLELAAAAITLSELSIDEPLPRHLAERALAAGYGDHGAAAVSRGGTMPIAIPQPEARTVMLPSTRPPASEPRPMPRAAEPTNVVSIATARPKPSMLPWFAAAACLGLAVGSIAYFTTRDGKAPPVASNLPIESKPSASEARAKLLAEAKDVVRTAWGETGDQAGKGETGEVVWSNERQEGYMTFRAVAANDPKATQYQLWIFDAERDERYPVDGGVFDVDTSKGEVTIPISAKVAVGKPTLFAVTVEKPGGVVVSKRERIVVAAKTAS
jgi:hypothetical protein